MIEMTNQLELIITVVVLLLQIGLIGLCYYKAKQPPDPLNPRLLNYPLLIILVSLTALATLAHVVSLATGSQVQPRRRRGM